MKILYLGYFCTEELFLQLSKADKDLSIAAHKYETQLLKNLSACVEPSNIQAVSILSYLQASDISQREDSFCGINLQYIWKKRSTIPNLSALKQVKKAVKKWLKETEGEERIVLTYATNFVLLSPFILRKRGVKIVTICSEIPQYRIQAGNKLKRWLKTTMNVRLNNRMDGYVFFSKYMSEATNPHNNPYIVVEGLPDIRISEEEINQDAHRPEQIFYAGYLIPENGIETLLQAFVQMQHDNVELVLCGSGTMSEVLEKYTAKCDCIKYLGSLPNDEILSLERQATLLINPRKADHLLTRYSFPSKTFEYFASGTPCVLTRLEGIPEEYYQYCYTCDASDAKALANDLDTVLDIPLSERLQKAREGFLFVKNEKSAAMQTKRIYQFLEEVAKG